MEKETFERYYNTYLTEELVGPSKNKTAQCPFCEKDGKFSVDITTGCAQCLSCTETCNHISFLTKFHNTWLDYTDDDQYASIAEARGLSVETLKKAKFAYNSISGVWLVPYKNPFTTQLTNLGYFYTFGDNAYRIFKAPNINGEIPLTFYNPYEGLKNSESKQLNIIEGEWDTLAWIELQSGHDLIPTIGAPGALIFPEKCKHWFKDFDIVNLYYDNDEAGLKGITKAAHKLTEWGKQVKAIDWSEVSEDEDLDGYDVRDMLQEFDDAYFALSSSLTSITNEVSPNSIDGDKLSDGYIASLSDITEITEFDKYIDCYGKHMHLTEENRRAIALTMAISTCQYMLGEPLWFFMVGQAGCGKTTLIESYGGNNEYFDYASRITSKSLVSGWNSGGDEPSLLYRMNGKTFFIKDFTVVLGMPKEQQKEVFDLLRDIYDGTLKITFGNGKVCNFHNLRFNLVAGVTDAIKLHNDASMGERFLRLDYMGKECDDIAIIQSTLKGFGQSSTRKKELTEATLGYAKTLIKEENRWNIENIPRMSTTSIDAISTLARYTAFIRTRTETDRQEGLKYRPRKEVASRLALQYAKVAFSLEKTFNPTFMNKAFEANGSGPPTIDFSDKTLQYVAKVAHDTSEGFNQEVVHAIHQQPRLGRRDLEARLKLPATRIHRVISDLKTIGLIKTVTRIDDHNPQVPLDRRGYGKNADKGRPSEYYSVHPDFLSIMDAVFPENKERV